ncbi:uncharacterized protein METZ01_LOCUS458660, partial [marine metagenome]
MDTAAIRVGDMRTVLVKELDPHNDKNHPARASSFSVNVMN